MNRTRTPRGLLCAALSVALALSMSPAAAFAEGEEIDGQFADVTVHPELTSPQPSAISTYNLPMRAMDAGTRPILNVTAPLKLFFNNSENGLDISNPANPTAQARFYSNGDPVRLLKASAEYKNQEDNPFNNADKLGIRINPMNTATSNYGTVEVTVVDDEEVAGPENVGGKLEVPLSGTSNQRTSKGYIVCSNTKFNFELYSTVGANTPDVTTDDRTVGQLVKEGLSGDGADALDFGSMVYTFVSDDKFDFFLEDQSDKNTPKDTWIYSLDEVKSHANSISDDVTNSDFYNMYYDFTKDKSSYSCNMKIKKSSDVAALHEPLLIIGVAQDYKSDGTGMAGLTFEFEDVLTQALKAPQSVYGKGYLASEIINTFEAGTTEPYKSIYEVLDNKEVRVRKCNSGDGARSGTFGESNERIFILTSQEMSRFRQDVFDVLLGSFMDGQTQIKKLYMYYYFAGDYNKYSSAPSRAKSTKYWTRNVNTLNGYATGQAIEADGTITGGVRVDKVLGISPCFCL